MAPFDVASVELLTWKMTVLAAVAPTLEACRIASKLSRSHCVGIEYHSPVATVEPVGPRIVLAPGKRVGMSEAP
jgi:hypothetical protein